MAMYGAKVSANKPVKLEPVRKVLWPVKPYVPTSSKLYPGAKPK